MIITDKEAGIEAGQEFAIDTFCPEDAPGVGRLFKEVYGEAYPAALVYDPIRLTEAFRKGDNIPLVARTVKGDVIGHGAYFHSGPNLRLYELGQGLVLPSYRKSGIIARLQEYALEEMAPSMELDVVMGETVCNHPYTQKSLALSHLVAMALEVDLMPAEAYAKEQSASGRVSTLLMFRTYHPKPHTVYVPQRYRDVFAFIYEGLDDKRTLSPSLTDGNPTGPHTAITTQIFDFARVARMSVHEGGKDFPSVFAAEESHALAKGMVVVQVWFKLSWPWVDSLVEYLRAKGYFFGGPLVQWFGDDGLLMQKIFGMPSWEEIQIHSDRGKKIMEYAKEDWERVSPRDAGPGQ